MDLYCLARSLLAGSEELQTLWTPLGKAKQALQLRMHIALGGYGDSGKRLVTNGVERTSETQLHSSRWTALSAQRTTMSRPDTASAGRVFPGRHRYRVVHNSNVDGWEVGAEIYYALHKRHTYPTTERRDVHQGWGCSGTNQSKVRQNGQIQPYPEKKSRSVSSRQTAANTVKTACARAKSSTSHESLRIPISSSHWM